MSQSYDREDSYVVYWARFPHQNNITTEGYVGITYDFEHRKSRHLSKSRTNINRPFYNAIRKYGEDALLWEIIYVGSSSMCFSIERVLRPSIHIGYNLAIGGAATMRGYKHSKEFSAKISAAQKGRKLTEEHKKRIGEAGKGVRKTPEQCLAQSIRNKGMNLGNKASDETKAKLCQIQQERVKLGVYKYPWLKSQQMGNSNWRYAPLVFELWSLGHGVWVINNLIKKHNPSFSAYAMVRSFKSGFNPNENIDYLNWLVLQTFDEQAAICSSSVLNTAPDVHGLSERGAKKLSRSSVSVI